MWGDTGNRYGSAHMGTNEPYFTRVARGGQQEKKKHRQIRGDKNEKKSEKELNERTPHQDISCAMSTTTVAK